ncbi:MAG: hypothetical protein HIU92_01620 [Proteobacteria bacterium]|nr:hypothetical protein [Pseudomonadota bacterium]
MNATPGPGTLRPDDERPRLPAPIGIYLRGDWVLRRRIRDLTSCQTGRLRGAANFSPLGEALLFTEHGRLALAQSEMEARQSYRFVIGGPAAFDVLFADGRPFHQAVFASRTAWTAHDCAPDTYRGRYRILGPNRWSLGWRITGPRKNLVVISIFSRAGGG